MEAFKADEKRIGEKNTFLASRRLGGSEESEVRRELFASNALGVFSGQEDINIGSQLGIQFLGVISVLIYTAVLTFIILKVVDAITGLRASEEQEQQGLDLVEHNESGYTL